MLMIVYRFGVLLVFLLLFYLLNAFFTENSVHLLHNSIDIDAVKNQKRQICIFFSVGSFCAAVYVIQSVLYAVMDLTREDRNSDVNFYEAIANA